MEGKVLLLDNQNHDLLLGEDALDFNYNGSDEEESSVTLKPLTTKDKSRVSVDSKVTSVLNPKANVKGATSLQIYERKAEQGVPFQHSLSNPLRHKDLFIIEGVILKHGLRFTINFIYGFNDIAFHLNPRLDQNYIARNSYINGEWGEEEGYAFMKNPLQSGKHFQIQIFVGESSYLVCLNGYHMFEFSHRIPAQSVEKIEVFGDIDLKTALLLSSEIYPNRSLMKYKRGYDNLHIPFTYKLEQELKPGQQIEIKGKIKLLPLNFRINFQSGEEFFPHPIIAYHLNVRYSPDCYVVQNTWGYTGEQWDEEIRSPLPLALSPGKEFVLNILFYDSYIMVKGDSWSLPVFKQRINLDNGTYIYIQGDITLSCFKVNFFRNKEKLPDAS